MSPHIDVMNPATAVICFEKKPGNCRHIAFMRVASMERSIGGVVLALPRQRAIAARVHKRSTVSARILGKVMSPEQTCRQMGKVEQVSQPSEMNCTASRREVMTQYVDGFFDNG